MSNLKKSYDHDIEKLSHGKVICNDSTIKKPDFLNNSVCSIITSHWPEKQKEEIEALQRTFTAKIRNTKLILFGEIS